MSSQSIRSLRHWHCHDCTRHLEQTRGIRLFTHTQHVDWSRQGESDCLITLWSKQVILRSIFSSMHCVSNLCESMEWIHDWESVVEKHAQTMLQLMDLVCVVYFGKPGELEQIVNSPVSQIVEEIAEVSKSLIVWSSILNLYFEEIKVFPAWACAKQASWSRFV